MADGGLLVTIKLQNVLRDGGGSFLGVQGGQELNREATFCFYFPRGGHPEEEYAVSHRIAWKGNCPPGKRGRIPLEQRLPVLRGDNLLILPGTDLAVNIPGARQPLYRGADLRFKYEDVESIRINERKDALLVRGRNRDLALLKFVRGRSFRQGSVRKDVLIHADRAYFGRGNRLLPRRMMHDLRDRSVVYVELEGSSPIAGRRAALLIPRKVSRRKTILTLRRGREEAPDSRGWLGLVLAPPALAADAFLGAMFFLGPVPMVCFSTAFQSPCVKLIRWYFKKVSE